MGPEGMVSPLITYADKVRSSRFSPDDRRSFEIPLIGPIAVGTTDTFRSEAGTGASRATLFWIAANAADKLKVLHVSAEPKCSVCRRKILS
jgi:hypothetical protein